MNEFSNKYFHITQGGKATIITLSAPYGIAVWGHLLELERKGHMLESQWIIVDFSKVVTLTDMGNEFYILRDELRRSKDVQLLYAGLSPQLENVLRMLENDIADPIKRFPTVVDAISSIDNAKHGTPPGETT